MAFEILPPNLGFMIPVQAVIELADLTAVSASQDFGADKTRRPQWFLIQVYQKAFTAGTGTKDVRYFWEVADDTGFATNKRTAGEVLLARADEQAGVIFGFSPKGAQQFGRVNITLDGTDAGTFDARISPIG